MVQNFTKRYKKAKPNTRDMSLISIGLEGYDIYKTFFSDLAKEKKKNAFDTFFILTAQMKDYSYDPQALNDKINRFLNNYQKSTDMRGQSKLLFKGHKFDIISKFGYVDQEILDEIADFRLGSLNSDMVNDIQEEEIFEPIVSSFSINVFFEKPLTDKYLELGFELLSELKEYCVDNLNVLNPKINCLLYANDTKFINKIRTDLKDQDIFDATNIDRIRGIQITNLDTDKMKTLVTTVYANLYFTKKIKYVI